MKIFILKEDQPESRVAASPDTVKKLIDIDNEVNIQSGAGLSSDFSDLLYEQAGGKIFSDISLINSADIILKVNKPSINELSNYKSNSILISCLDPYNNQELVKELKTKILPLLLWN